MNIKTADFEVRQENVIVGAGNLHDDGTVEIYKSGKTSQYATLLDMAKALPGCDFCHATNGKLNSLLSRFVSKNGNGKTSFSI